MEHSAYVFATDLEDEGVDRVLANLQERARLTGVTVAAAYHAGRDILPHNPRSKMRFLDPGAVFFHPDERLYRDTRIKPRVSATTGGHDTLARASEAAAARGMHVQAWVVFLHVDWRDDLIGAVARNAFDDPFLTDLCPANPDARAYAVALAADVARYRPASIVAESLSYPLLEHGYHHERYLLHLGPLAVPFELSCSESSTRVTPTVASTSAGSRRLRLPTASSAPISGCGRASSRRSPALSALRRARPAPG